MHNSLLKLVFVVGLLIAAMNFPTTVCGEEQKSKELAQSTSSNLIAQISVESAYKELNDKFFWFHPYLGAIPGAGSDGNPQIIALMQKHLVADDHYSETYLLETNDLGKNWTVPAEVKQLRWMERGKEHLAVSSPVPRWHAKTGKLLAFGHSNLHNSSGGFVNRPGSTWSYYTVYHPKSKNWSSWKPVGKPGNKLFATASGCSQWLVKTNGEILLPVYFQIKKGGPWKVEVWKCRFDGTTVSPVSQSNRLIRDDLRGIGEPSLTRFQNSYYLTIRSDDGAFVSRSSDGQKFEPIKPWKFDDGKPLGSYNTQQHWVTHSEGLFLAYTRRGANNDHVFRHRAPIFVAQVDPERLVVLRNTEQTVFPDKGVPMGNFGVIPVNEKETWITTGENMWKYGGRPATYKGAEGAVLVGRIRWSKPNSLVNYK